RARPTDRRSRAGGCRVAPPPPRPRRVRARPPAAGCPNGCRRSGSGGSRGHSGRASRRRCAPHCPACPYDRRRGARARSAPSSKPSALRPAAREAPWPDVVGDSSSPGEPTRCRDFRQLSHGSSVVDGATGRYYIRDVISITREDCRPLTLRHAANLLQALAHPVRLQILDVVRERPCTVGEIVERVGLAQPVISRHLAVLRREGVLSVAPSGRERVYRLAGCRVEPLLEVLFDSP